MLRRYVKGRDFPAVRAEVTLTSRRPESHGNSDYDRARNPVGSEAPAFGCRFLNRERLGSGGQPVCQKGVGGGFLGSNAGKVLGGAIAFPVAEYRLGEELLTDGR